MPKSISLAYAGAVVSTFFWGTNFNAGAYIAGHMPPLTASVERFLVATVLIFALFGLRGGLRLETLRRNLLAYVVVGLLGVVGFNAALFYGLKSTTPINGALIMATTPLWTVALAVAFERDRVDALRAFGLVLGLAGVTLVISRGSLEMLLAMHVASGDLIILAGSIAWALTTVISRRSVSNATPIETTAFSMLFGVAGLLVLGFAFEHPARAMIAAPVGVHAALLYLAAFGSVIGYSLWFAAAQRIGSARTAIFFNLVPVFTMLVSTVLGTPPNLWQLVGAAAVLAGVAFVSGMVRIRPAARALPS